MTSTGLLAFFHLQLLLKTKNNAPEKQVCAPYVYGFYTDMISVRLTDKQSSPGQGDNLASRISARFHLFFARMLCIFPELC